MDRKIFARARAEAVRAIREDTTLSTTARLVGIQVAEFHLNPGTIGAWPSQKTVGDAIGRHSKTVQRALKELEIAGHIKIEKRGPRATNRILFLTIETAAAQANRRNREAGQSCSDVVTKMSGTMGRKCPPNLKKEPRKKPLSSADLSFPEYKIPPGSRNAEAWNKALAEHSLPPLQSYKICGEDAGMKVFIVPANWPPAPDEIEAWKRIELYFQDRMQ